MTVAQDEEGGPARRRGEDGPAHRCGDGAPSRRLLDADWFNKLLIVSCALAWGFSFFLMKDVTAEFPVFWLLFVRFGIASLLMLAVFWRRIRAHVTGSVIRTGIVLGVFYGLGYVFQTFGIVFTTPGKNAFLTGIYCVLVPFCAWAMGKGAPRRTSVIAALVSLAGMGLVVLDNGLPLNVGDLLTLVGAVFFALEMVVVASEGRDKDVWALTFWQFVTITAIVGAGTLALERPPEAELFTPGNVGSLVFLAVICSFAALAVGFALPVALLVADEMVRYVTAFFLEHDEDDEDAPSLGGFAVKGIALGLFWAAVVLLVATATGRVVTTADGLAGAVPLALGGFQATALSVLVSFVTAPAYLVLLRRRDDAGKDTSGLVLHAVALVVALVAFACAVLVTAAPLVG